MSNSTDAEAEESREISRLFKKDPTAANYVSLRRRFPHVVIEVAVTGGIDPLFQMRDELESNGISADLMASVFDADPVAIGKISLTLLERIVEAEKLRTEGETGLVRRKLTVPTMLIDWIIACCLDALSWNDELHIPRDLIMLIRERLGGADKLYKQQYKAYRSKWDAVLTAALRKAMNKDCTYRDVGRVLNVAPSTVKRWFKPGEFEQERDRWAKHFDPNGNFSMVPPGEKIDPTAMLARIKSQLSD